MTAAAQDAIRRCASLIVQLESIYEVVIMAIPRIEVMLHRILLRQKRLSVGAVDLVTGERNILVLAAYHSHLSPLRKVSNTSSSERRVMILLGLTQQSSI
jgi:hypothetical protein